MKYAKLLLNELNWGNNTITNNDILYLKDNSSLYGSNNVYIDYEFV